MNVAYLVLDDGTVFPGTAWGATGAVSSDLHMCTAMTGYQGVLASDEAAGRIVLMTAPHVGNVGINDETSTQLTVAGVVVREPARRPSNWKARGPLDAALTSQGVIGIAGVDTRAVTLHVRRADRPFRAVILSGEALPPHASYAAAQCAPAGTTGGRPHPSDSVLPEVVTAAMRVLDAQPTPCPAATCAQEEN